MDYSLEREQFGKPIAENQALAFTMADMATQLHGARLVSSSARAVLEMCARVCSRAPRSAAHSHSTEREAPLRAANDLHNRVATHDAALVRQVLRHAAGMLDALKAADGGVPGGAAAVTAACAMAKVTATDVGFKVCNDALQVHGGYGYLNAYPVERMVRDVRVHQILEGTNQIMRHIVSRTILK